MHHSGRSGESRILFDREDSAIFPAACLPAWSKNSRTVYYIAYDAEQYASFWSVPVSGGKPILLVKFDDPAQQTIRWLFATE